MRVGIVGCGDVTNLYLPTLARLPQVQVVACADLDPARSAALSAKGGFRAVPVEALLADPAVEVVLNLTPPLVHASVSLAAIAAGKHVYTEKPFATNRADARAILAAASAAGVRVGAATDTFLGGGLQTARAVLDDGVIGDPVAVNATVAHTGPERWHHDPGIFYGEGGGPLLDVGPYYLAALVNLIGPVVSATGVGRGVGSERTIARGPRAGETIVSAVFTHAVAAYTFRSGVVAGFTASFDVPATTAPKIEIHGTRGSMHLGDPNEFDGFVCVREAGANDWTDVPLRFDTTLERGIGLADLIDAIGEDRPARASGELAYHVLDALLATEEAAASGQARTVESSVERPEPLGQVVPRRRSASSRRSMSASADR